jgi:endonuclease/exonuclease/phosphatase (EEP) superfamily protein YafD
VVALRRPAPLAVAALGALSWLGLWGELFLPRSSARTRERSVVVLSYNALGYNQNPRGTLDVIRDSAADIVALQELNLETDRLVERELATLYPYRWLEPRPGVNGGGILSKYPFTRGSSPLLAGTWVSSPMVITLDVSGKALAIVRFHAVAGPVFVHDRERQARSPRSPARSAAR